MNPCKIEFATRCDGGGGAGKIKPTPPPAATTAAENLAKARILERTRRARGFESTLLGSVIGETQSQTAIRRLLG